MAVENTIAAGYPLQLPATRLADETVTDDSSGDTQVVPVWPPPRETVVGAYAPLVADEPSLPIYATATGYYRLPAGRPCRMSEITVPLAGRAQAVWASDTFLVWASALRPWAVHGWPVNAPKFLVVSRSQVLAYGFGPDATWQIFATLDGLYESKLDPEGWDAVVCPARSHEREPGAVKDSEQSAWQSIGGLSGYWQHGLPYTGLGADGVPTYSFDGVAITRVAVAHAGAGWIVWPGLRSAFGTDSHVWVPDDPDHPLVSGHFVVETSAAERADGQAPAGPGWVLVGEVGGTESLTEFVRIDGTNTFHTFDDVPTAWVLRLYRRADVHTAVRAACVEMAARRADFRGLVLVATAPADEAFGTQAWQEYTIGSIITPQAMNQLVSGGVFDLQVLSGAATGFSTRMATAFTAWVSDL